MTDLPPPPPAAPAMPAPAAAPRSRTPWIIATCLLAVSTLLAGGVAAVAAVGQQRAQDRTAAATAKVAELEERIDELESAAAADGPVGGLGDLGDLGGLLDGLLGDGGLDGLGDLGDLEELFDGLFGDGGLDGLGDALDGLGDLDPGAAAGLAQCVDLGGGDGAALPTDVEEALPTIVSRVEADRGLVFGDDVDAAFLDADELTERVRTLTLEEYTEDEAAVDARLLTALGAVAPGTDLRDTLTQLLGDQVAGFYDPETGELVVGSEGELDGATQIFLAHELVHALGDEAIGLPDLDDFEGDDDAALATLALVEGDATLAMQRYAARHLSLAEQLDAATGADTSSLDAVPAYLTDQLVFPYVEGLTWVCEQFVVGGWDAVDAAYAAPPATTLEILDPDRIGFVAEPVPVLAPPAVDWTEIDRRSIGAADLKSLFGAPGDDRAAAIDDPRSAAMAWRGGYATTWDRDGATTVGLALTGEASLCDDVIAWYGAAFDDDTASVPQQRGAVGTFTGGMQEAAVRCDGDAVLLAVAPDVGTATAVITG